MFNYSSTFDQDIDKSFSFLTKRNEGFFKSEAQKNFLLKQANATLGNPSENAWVDMAKMRGIELKDNEIFIDVSGYVRWADYGTKSIRRCGWVYVLDEYGVVAKYKLGYAYDKGYSCVDPKKTQWVWSRSAVAVLPVFEKAVAEDVVTTHLGEVGEKIDVVGKITKIASYDKTPMGHWDSAVGYKAEIQVGTATLIYWGFPQIKVRNVPVRDAVEGLIVNVKATVKAHGEYKGKKQTTISRPKFSIVEEKEVA